MNDYDLSILRALDELKAPVHGAEVAGGIPVQECVKALYHQIYMKKFSAYGICEMAVRRNVMDSDLLHFVAWDFDPVPSIGESLRRLIERFKLQQKNKSILYFSPALVAEDTAAVLQEHKSVFESPNDLNDAIIETPCMEFYLKRSEMTQIRSDLLESIDEALGSK
jgi:hypothetical protein